MNKKIMIIKHGSLGDIILSLGAIKSIKMYFDDCKIYLLTSSKYYDLMKNCPYIDKIIIDDRNPIYFFLKNVDLAKKIFKHNFHYIIDLQNSKRTFFYNILFRLFSKSIISSSRPMAHLRYTIPPQGYEHVTTGLKNQLHLMKIKKFYEPDIEWLSSSNVNNIKFDNSYVVIIPGTSKRGEKKRWPSDKYAKLTKFLIEKDLSVVIVGNKSDYESARPIFEMCPKAYNLIDKSPPEILYSLAKNAKFIISNDTGPALLVSLSRTPVVWLVNENAVSLSNKPIGKIIKISSNSIRDITVEKVKEIVLKENLI